MILPKILSLLKRLLYSGADRQFYIDHASVIDAHNSRNLRILSRCALLFFAGYLLVCPLFPALRTAAPLYGTYCVISLVFIVFIETYYHYMHALPKRFCFLFSAIFLSYSLLLGTVFSQHGNATMYFVLSITLSTVFNVPVLVSALFNLCFGVLFIIAAFHFKASPYAIIDFSNWIASYFITCVAAYSLNSAHVGIIKTREQLEASCNTDELTGLNNRRNMNQYLFQAYQLSPRLHIVLLDIDDFKVYNDTYGHIEGDYCLQAVARVLREKSIQYGVYVARYGGEEFCLMDTTRTSAQMENLVQDVLDSVAALGIRNENAPHAAISLSAGLVSKEDTWTHSCIDLLDLADEALYGAKKIGKNTYSFPQACKKPLSQSE